MLKNLGFLRGVCQNTTVYKLLSLVNMLVETNTSMMFPMEMVQQGAGVWGLESETGFKINNFSEMFSIEKHLGNKLKA